MMLVGSLSLKAEEIDILKNIPKDTKLIIKLKADNLKGTALYKSVSIAYLDKIDMLQEFFDKHIGFDPFEQDEIWLLSPAPKKFMIFVKGKFDHKNINQTFGQLPQVVLKDNKNAKFAADFQFDENDTWKSVLVLNDECIAFGDIDSMAKFNKVITNEAAEIKLDEKTLKLLKNPRNAFSATFLEGIKDWPDMDKNITKFIKTLSITANAADDLMLKVDLEAFSKKHAEGIHNLFTGFQLLDLADKKMKNNVALMKLIKNAKSRFEGKQVYLSSSINGDSLLKVLPGANLGQEL